MPTLCHYCCSFHLVRVIFRSCLLFHLWVCSFYFVIFHFHCVVRHYAVVSRYFLILNLYIYFCGRNSILEIIFVMCLHSVIIVVHSIELEWSSGVICSFICEFFLSFSSYFKPSVVLAILLSSVGTSWFWIYIASVSVVVILFLKCLRYAPTLCHNRYTFH